MEATCKTIRPTINDFSNVFTHNNIILFVGNFAPKSLLITVTAPNIFAVSLQLVNLGDGF
jgi:hypothetical protein